VDQRTLVEATTRRSLADGLVLIVSQADANNTHSLERRFRQFLEFIFDTGYIVTGSAE